MRSRLAARFASATLVFGSYALVAVLFNWPLPQLLRTHLTGTVAGDTGVYVWNQWVFRHEVVAHHRFPLLTSEVLTLSPPVDLSLHNYTLFADIVAFPLIPWLGVTATFNVVYLLFVAMTAWAMYELARSVVRRTPEAWLAGLLFGFCPVFMARATAHFSLSAAAPLPLFLLAFRRAERDGDLRFAALSGVLAAWAFTWDAYYGIFCAVVAGCYLMLRYVRVSRDARQRLSYPRGLLMLDGTILVLLAIIATIVATGAEELRAVGQVIRLRPLHGPVMAVTVLCMARVWMHFQPVVSFAIPSWRTVLMVPAVVASACAVALFPVLFFLWRSMAEGTEFHGPIFWRSSPPGVDLLSFLVPNPNLAWLTGSWRGWLDGLPNGYAENVASLPLVSLGVMLIAVVWYRFRPGRLWSGLAICLAAIALGPFVRIGGIDTHIPGPWALLRYVPILTATRTPTRYVIPLMMVFAVLFAMALARVTSRSRRFRPLILTAVGIALCVELSPYPRGLYAAHVPDVFRIIAADPRDVTVLNLPFGLRSGEWSQGNFTAATQFYQTVHQKRLIGGYLSRITEPELARQRQFITVRRLIRLSQGEQLSQRDLDEVKARAGIFIGQARLGYVVVNTATTPPALHRLATEAYGLRQIAESDGFILYVPTVAMRAEAARPSTPSD